MAVKPVNIGTSYYCPPDSSNPIPWDSLTEKEKKLIYIEQSKRASFLLSAYYNHNLEAYRNTFLNG